MQVIATQQSKQLFSLTEEMNDQDARRKMVEINTSGKGGAVIEDGKLIVRDLLID